MLVKWRENEWRPGTYYNKRLPTDLNCHRKLTHDRQSFMKRCCSWIYTAVASAHGNCSINLISKCVYDLVKSAWDAEIFKFDNNPMNDPKEIHIVDKIDPLSRRSRERLLHRMAWLYNFFINTIIKVRNASLNREKKEMWIITKKRW